LFAAGTTRRGDLPRHRLLLNLGQLHLDKPLLLHQKLHCSRVTRGRRRFSLHFFRRAQPIESKDNDNYCEHCHCTNHHNEIAA